jgi:hypothetical protein
VQGRPRISARKRRDVREPDVPAHDPGGSNDVLLVFRPVAGGPGNNRFNLNRVQFEGAGISDS